MFRRYTTIHIMITTAAFSVALVWIIISATKHNTAKADCLTDFFSNTTSTSVTGDEGDILCNIFTWVDVGLMGGLWIILAIMQVRQLYSYRMFTRLYQLLLLFQFSSICIPSSPDMALASARTRNHTGTFTRRLATTAVFLSRTE